MTRQFGSIISKDEDMFVALCPELDIVSQGYTIEEARYNLKEAIELFFECAPDSEVKRRMKSESYYTNIEVEIA